MKRAAAFAVVLGVLSACASNPIPEGYQGPTAIIRDTAIQQGSTRALFFYVSEVDGKRIQNNLGLTRSANQGRGNMISPVPAERKVPAQKLVLKLEARAAHGAPISEILNSANMYTASAIIALDAKPDTFYIVKGTLTHGTRNVRLEDAKNGEHVGAKVESEQPK